MSWSATGSACECRRPEVHAGCRDDLPSGRSPEEASSHRMASDGRHEPRPLAEQPSVPLSTVPIWISSLGAAPSELAGELATVSTTAASAGRWTDWTVLSVRRAHCCLRRMSLVHHGSVRWVTKKTASLKR